MSLWLHVLFHEDIAQLEQKIPALGIHVIKAYTEFQQYLCIIFEDMSILLSAIFIFHGLILLLVAETSEQHRYLVTRLITMRSKPDYVEIVLLYITLPLKFCQNCVSNS